MGFHDSSWNICTCVKFDDPSIISFWDVGWKTDTQTNGDENPTPVTALNVGSYCCWLKGGSWRPQDGWDVVGRCSRPMLTVGCLWSWVWRLGSALRVPSSDRQPRRRRNSLERRGASGCEQRAAAARLWRVARGATGVQLPAASQRLPVWVEISQLRKWLRPSTWSAAQPTTFHVSTKCWFYVRWF